MAQQSQLPLPRVPDGELSVHPAPGECITPALSHVLENAPKHRLSNAGVLLSSSHAILEWFGLEGASE